MPNAWKKGRGKLGFMQPLLGRWTAMADSPMGPLECTREFTSVLGGAYVLLQATWKFSAKPAGMRIDLSKYGSGYQEIALFGAGDKEKAGFWSFTSDGKHSQGTLADVRDLHKSAFGFLAEMPAGLARMAYWPD